MALKKYEDYVNAMVCWTYWLFMIWQVLTFTLKHIVAKLYKKQKLLLILLIKYVFASFRLL